MDKWVSNYKKAMLSVFKPLDWKSCEPVYSQVPHKPSLLRFSGLSSQDFTHCAYFYLRESSTKSKHTKRNTNPNGHSIFLPQDICCSWTLSPLCTTSVHAFLALQTKYTKIKMHYFYSWLNAALLRIYKTARKHSRVFWSKFLWWIATERRQVNYNWHEKLFLMLQL